MEEKNYAFIDGQNMYVNILNQGWKIDYIRFRRYLSDKYKVKKAYIFFGYIEQHRKMYEFIEKAGYCIIFREISKTATGIKGNCDSDLIFRLGMEFWNFDKALIVSGDGDFFPILEVLYELKKLAVVMAPNKHMCSQRYFMLKENQELVFMNNFREKISLNKKDSLRTEP